MLLRYCSEWCGVLYDWLKLVSLQQMLCLCRKTSKGCKCNTEQTNTDRVCLVICAWAGVMYWGDGKLDKIEKANLDATGRTVLLTETYAVYFAFALHAGNIYFTDRNTNAYGYFFSLAAKSSNSSTSSSSNIQGVSIPRDCEPLEHVLPSPSPDPTYVITRNTTKWHFKVYSCAQSVR